jgi:hypothetical protein
MPTAVVDMDAGSPAFQGVRLRSSPPTTPGRRLRRLPSASSAPRSRSVTPWLEQALSVMDLGDRAGPQGGKWRLRPTSAGATTTELAALHNVSHRLVARICREQGVVLRPQGRRMKLDLPYYEVVVVNPSTSEQRTVKTLPLVVSSTPAMSEVWHALATVFANSRAHSLSGYFGSAWKSPGRTTVLHENGRFTISCGSASSDRTISRATSTTTTPTRTRVAMSHGFRDVARAKLGCAPGSRRPALPSSSGSDTERDATQPCRSPG